MNFCDLIVRMEQTGLSPRPVVGAIVVVSGLAVSFLLWLLYVHHASADFAGRWIFLPALNALLNGLCAIALCVGLYFIKLHNREAHRTSMLLAFAFSSVFLISYIVNHTMHGDTIFHVIQYVRRFQVPPEGLFQNNSRPPTLAAVQSYCSQTFNDWSRYRRGRRHIEQMVWARTILLQLL